MSALAAAVFALASWFILHRISLPAFGGSYVTRAISTAITVLVLLITVVALFGLTMPWQRRRKAHRPNQVLRAIAYFFAYLAPAFIVISTIAIPLSSTRLYLDGISVDQEFRTEYLTRMAAQSGLHDMAYAEIPSFYPAGWFWLGGRFANVLGLPGWEAFQPFAIVTLAVAGAVLVPVWQRITASLPTATAIALISTCLALVTSADEPYAAVIAMGIPAAVVLAGRAMQGGRFAAVGVTLFLGISATFYTLHTAVAALSVVLIALVTAWSQKRWQPIVMLAGIGIGSMVIAASVWAPYVLAVLRGEPRSGATASHYLPDLGAQMPLPMLAGSIVGLLCLIGSIWLLVRSIGVGGSQSPVETPAEAALARPLALSALTMYAWVGLSMVVTLLGQTLLGFRLAPPITILLATAGALGVADVLRHGVVKLWPQVVNRDVALKVSAIAALFALLAGVNYAQAIPQRLHHAIDLAHTDTDGYGERADRFAPNAGKWYGEVNDALLDAGLDPNTSVILTDERNFQAYFPWYSFQALTSHYANPLGEFDKRNAAIESWSEATSADELIELMDSTPWHGPDALVLSTPAHDDDPYTIDIADDIYPNNPNVLFRGIPLPRELFENHWSVTTIGPFTVLVRD